MTDFPLPEYPDDPLGPEAFRDLADSMGVLGAPAVVPISEDTTLLADHLHLVLEADAPLTFTIPDDTDLPAGFMFVLGNAASEGEVTVVAGPKDDYVMPADARIVVPGRYVGFIKLKHGKWASALLPVVEVVDPPVDPTSGYNEATGGTVKDFTRDGNPWRRHTFLTGADLTVVKNPKPFTVYLIGGGAGGGKNGFDGGGPHGGGKGGGGGYHSSEVTLAVGVAPVVVGAAGTAGTNTSGGAGGDSSVGGLKAGGGGGGAWGQDAITGGDGRVGVPAPGANGGDGGGNNHPQTSPCTGKQAAIGLAVTVGEGGNGGASDGGGGSNPGAAGNAGAVVVEYEIEPPDPASLYNEATGGTITEVANYNGTGKTWVVHTFTSTADLVITKSPKPFRVLVAGGGGGGGRQVDGNTRCGSGGGGGLIESDAATLAVGTRKITVGAGGAGSYPAGGFNGGDSSIDAQFVALGGGAGGHGVAGANGAAGGSGGGGVGGGMHHGIGGGGTGTPGQGFNGTGGEDWAAGVGGAGGGAGGAASGYTGGPGKASTITGASVVYCSGGNGPASAYGGGGAGGVGWQGAGAAGVVVVAYEKAPPPPPSYNEATGGTVTQYKDGDGKWWRVHKFLANGSLTVTKAGAAFRVLVVGGGGGGAALSAQVDDEGGGGGAGGYLETGTATIAVGTHPVVVGAGGAINADGAASSLLTLVANGGKAANVYMGGASGDGVAPGNGANANGSGGGGAGQTGWSGYDWYGGDGGDGKQSSITGVATWYAGGGGSGGIKGAGRTDGWEAAKPYCRRPERRADAASTLAAGGRGGGGSTQTSQRAGVDGLGGGGCGASDPGKGGSGVVIVSYQIDTPPVPDYNEVVGGTVTNYTKDGKKYAVHSITASGSIEIKAAVKPFRVLAVGAGFNGAIGDYSAYGGGGGAVVEQAAVTLADGVYTATIGMPSGGNTSLSIGGVDKAFAQGAQGGNGVPGSPGGGAGAGNGGQGADGTFSTITGENKGYGGGGSSVNWNYCCDPCCFGGVANSSGGGSGRDCAPAAHYYGGGGGRAQHTCGSPNPGYQGIIIISYEVAP